MKNRLLKKAEKQFNYGNYSNVIRLLEPEVFRYRENSDFYYYLGISCLLLRDFSGANSYLRRSLQIDPSDSRTMLGLAAIHLKHNSPSEAIKIWLDILDKDPRNSYAKKGLAILKNNVAMEKIPEDFFVKNLHRIIPYRKAVVLYKSLRVAAVLALIAMLSATLFYSWNYITKKTGKIERLYPELVISRDISDIVAAGDFTIELDSREIVRIFETAKKHFLDSRDNEARIEINRLLNSNASEQVKEKARLLSGYLREPDFRYFVNTITYRDVVQYPYLYNQCYVKWSGKIANIQVHEKHASFDFLVGYDTGRVLEGIVKVTTDFPVVLDEEFTYDIIGRLDTENKISLKAVTLRNYIK